jgi:two-component system, CAI-1 autoinducer sensor kinase/phosphatase CqsS
MYSLLPALVSGLFLAYGIYVVAAKGINRITISFFVLCIATFFWQGTWAVLYQVEDAQAAAFLVKLGYFLILFLPTSLYHFLAEISSKRSEYRWIAASYGLSAVLAVLTLSSNWVIDGYYTYFWGYYPKAGLLHPLHVMQTTLVVSRGLFIAWQQQQNASSAQLARLRLCVSSVLIYFLAAIDYLCNYGFSFYPPGVVFIAISLSMLSFAVARHDLMKPFAAAATIAHELRTPLATIRMQADFAAQQLPQLINSLRQAQAQGYVNSQDNTASQAFLENICQKIVMQVDRTNKMIDLILASSRMEHIDTSDFEWHPMQACVQETLDHYPFLQNERKHVRLLVEQDFDFYGSPALLNFVLSNLIKNSLYAMRAAEKGSIAITLAESPQGNTLRITDTASGIAKTVIGHIFDTYYSTKSSSGAGLGLPFCKQVLKAFGGQISCETLEGEYTTFILSFPTRDQRVSPRTWPISLH